VRSEREQSIGSHESNMKRTGGEDLMLLFGVSCCSFFFFFLYLDLETGLHPQVLFSKTKGQVLKHLSIS
jgi:hypothetical protein